MNEIKAVGIVCGTSETMRTKWRKVFRQASIKLCAFPVGVFSEYIYVENKDDLKIGDKVEVIVRKYTNQPPTP